MFLVSETKLPFADLTDVALADEDTMSIPADTDLKTIQGIL